MWVKHEILIAEQKHLPGGVKRDGAEAASLGAAAVDADR